MLKITPIRGYGYKRRGSYGKWDNAQVLAGGTAHECGGDQKGICNNDDLKNQRSFLHGIASRDQVRKENSDG